MPLYEYKCQSCGFTFEVLQKATDGPLKACESCGGKLTKLLTAPAIQFKGNGWYVTDYAGKKQPAENERAPVKASKGEIQTTSKEPSQTAE